MIVAVSGGEGGVTAAVEDPQNLKQLRAEFRGVDDAEAAEALRAAGLGTIDGDYVWVDADALRAAGDGSSGWTAEFYGMLAYAKTRGWTDADSTRVRAHIVRSLGAACPAAPRAAREDGQV
jgi:hypothetical protein